MTKYLRCINTDDHHSAELVLGGRYEITNETDHGYFVGNLGHYTKVPDGDGRSYRMWFVLETEGGESMENVVEIDGVKYREVKRKAAVGEKIKVTAEYSMGEKIGGRILTVTDHSCGLIDTDGFWNDGSALNLNDSEYVVLQPITEYPRVDIAASDVDLIVLQRKLNGLKRQQAELTKQISDLAAQADGLTDAFVKLAAKAVVPQDKPKDKPKSRDEIVAQAKRDVAELSTMAINDDVVPTIEGDVEAFFPGDADYVDFVVNRDKRTVVALIRYIGDNDVWAKGIAKAAPGDVFNVHIGKAIALRRALGLEVPTEYTNAPQPEDVRVGDVVIIVDNSDTNIGMSRHLRESKYYFVCQIDFSDGYPYSIAKLGDKSGIWSGRRAFEIADDSDRYESEVSA